MFVQNFIKLSAAVHELSWRQRKNSAENNTAMAATLVLHPVDSTAKVKLGYIIVRSKA